MPAVAQRVRSVDVRVFREPAEVIVDRCLECWARCTMGRGAAPAVRTMGGLSSNLDGYGAPIDEAQFNRDAEIGAATGAMIDGLSRLHQWAVFKACSVGQVWGFPHADLSMTFAEAKLALEIKLRRNGCTILLF